jgi:DNA-binding response OmpR family regulator
MMTGEVVVENTIGALRGGADDFVGKPVHLDELQFALKRALQRRHRELSSGLPRLLIVTDSQAWANHLVTALRTTDVEVTVTTTPEELRQAVEEEHDIAIVDVEALELRNVLAALRASPAHTEIPILVEISHLAANANISGVLPQYRAMPCNTTDLISLARRRLAAMIARPTSYEVAGMRPLL